MDEIDVLNEKAKDPTDDMPYVRNDQIMEAVQNLIEGQVRTLQLIHKLINKIDAIEKQANEMTSPDALMTMAQSLMPGMLNGGGFGG